MAAWIICLGFLTNLLIYSTETNAGATGCKELVVTCKEGDPVTIRDPSCSFSSAKWYAQVKNACLLKGDEVNKKVCSTPCKSTRANVKSGQQSGGTNSSSVKSNVHIKDPKEFSFE